MTTPREIGFYVVVAIAVIIITLRGLYLIFKGKDERKDGMPKLNVQFTIAVIVTIAGLVMMFLLYHALYYIGVLTQELIL